MAKIKTDFKEYDCNCCGHSKCDGDVIRGKRGMFKKFIACPGPVDVRPMRVTLLERASEHEGFATELNRIARNMNMIFQERKYYPYFRFLMT